MSLINKMLQDLDARGGDGARADASSVVRPVRPGGRGGLSPAAVGGGLLAVALLGGAGFAAYKYFRGGAQPASAPVAARAPAAAPVAKPAIQPARGPAGPVVGDEGAPVVQGDQSPEAHRAAGERLSRKMEERNAAARRAVAGRSGPDTKRMDPAPIDTASLGAPATRPVPRLAAQRANELAEAKRKAAPGAAGAKGSAASGAVGSAGEGGDAGLSSQQKAENEYRRALTNLQDARVSEAIAGLEHAVYLYPRHDAARQTLVSLLIEGGRRAEAIRHLTFATSLDPRQTNMAMLLARLQLESGGNALDSLQRSLPYAESNPEYRALLAGVLQRANRHKEAVDHYQAAVRLQPGNAVWWMGMGISLQADKRNAEARIAFQRARDSGRLAPELQAFVERRLQQLN